MTWGRYPLIIVRLPEVEPRWRDILKACTGLMREHGLRQKDVSAIESVDAGYTDKQAAEFRPVLEGAFAGGPGLAKFWLYEWQEPGFVLVRRPVTDK